MQLYAVFEDDDGHRYLIKKEDYPTFDNAHDDIYESYREHREDDIYYEELNTLLEGFGAKTLEGDLYYVVLDEELEE